MAFHDGGVGGPVHGYDRVLSGFHKGGHTADDTRKAVIGC